MKSNFAKQILTLLLLTGLASTAQDRVNAKYIEFENVSDTLKKATGWYLNPNSQKWIDNDNALNKEHVTNMKEDWRGIAIKNFNYIVTNSVSLDKEKVYTILVDSYGSAYEYPAIKRGLYTVKHATFYVFTETEFRKLDKIAKGKITELKIKDVVHLDKNNPDSYKNALTKAITEKSKFKRYETFSVTKAENGAIRFLLPATRSKYSDDGFDRGYFETDEQNFSKIILK